MLCRYLNLFRVKEIKTSKSRNNNNNNNNKTMNYDCTYQIGKKIKSSTLSVTGYEEIWETGSLLSE